jgi:hypothetical protein
MGFVESRHFKIIGFGLELVAETIEAAGGAVAYALAWLNEAARDPAWIKYKAQSAQLELF